MNQTRKIIEKRLPNMNYDQWVVGQIGNRQLNGQAYHPDEHMQNIETLLARLLILSLANIDPKP